MAKECDNTACDRESCEGCPSAGKVDFSAPMNKNSRIAHVIGIMSGKGGVGKSSVTALLAAALSHHGFRVGILDADITGPSIPHLFGVENVQPLSDGEEIMPVETLTGLRLISINLMLEDPSEPVIWRGPVLGSVIKQFWSDVAWGELDYLLVDMPPGTGDVPLTLFQSLPMDGVVLVSSPQSLVNMVVGKARNMAKMMNIPVLAAVENFAYLDCPGCGKRIYPFGQGKTRAWAEANDVPFALELSMDPAVSAYGDEGRIEFYPGNLLDALIPYLKKE